VSPSELLASPSEGRAYPGGRAVLVVRRHLLHVRRRHLRVHPRGALYFDIDPTIPTAQSPNVRVKNNGLVAGHSTGQCTV
jgi:hypothetical protein